MNIKKYFNMLNKKVDYLLLRNIEQVKDNTFKDLDILISKIDIEIFKEYTDMYINEEKLVLIQMVENFTGIVYILKDETNRIFEIDARWYMFYKNELYDGNILLKEKIKKDNIHIPNEFNYLIHLLLHNKKNKYQTVIDILSKKYSDRENEIKELIKSIKISKTSKFFMSISFIIKKVIYSKREPLIVLHGTDGVGKTTALNLVLEDFEKDSVKFFSIHAGGRKATLLPVRKVKKNKIHKKKNNIIYDMARMIYHYIDFIYMYYTVLFKNLIYGKKIILDKYFVYNLKYEEMGFNVPRFFAESLYYIVPKPDVFIFLWNEPDEILKRKQERTYREIIEDQKKLEQFGKLSKNFYKVKTDKEAILVKEEILNILKSFK